ncbi:MAG TPA: hypothetical protein VM686_43010 [Polyangiaceae bacterium]|nr:hypothetical protein [Polyangiaceae bacterium]
MFKPASTLAVTTLALLVACYGTSASDDDEATGGTAAGGTKNTGGSGGSSNSGGSAGSGSGGTNKGGTDSGGTDSGGATSGDAGAGNAAAGGTPPWELWQACSAPEDCTVVPTNTCCGCVPMGVNKDYEADALAAAASFDPSQCPEGLGCPYQPCPPDSMVGCEMGVCVPLPGCSERSEQDCDLDGLCEKYNARLCSSADDFAYFACGKPKGTCDDALTCMVSPFGQEVLFPDSCVPDGYTQPCVSQCL